MERNSIYFILSLCMKWVIFLRWDYRIFVDFVDLWILIMKVIWSLELVGMSMREIQMKMVSGYLCGYFVFERCEGLLMKMMKKMMVVI